MPIRLHQYPSLRQGIRQLGRSLSWLLVLSLPAIAQGPIAVQPTADHRLISSRAYNPPAGSQGSGGASTGGGVRGCGDEELIAIAPLFDTPGQTYATRPTFVWYLRGDSPEQIVFELYHPAAADEVIYRQELTPTASGYQAVALPAAAEALQPGETYRWEAIIYCDGNTNIKGRWIAAEISVVEPPRGIALLDEVAPTPEQKGIRLAQAGYWYDAIAQVYAGETAGEQRLRRDLLLDLADIADAVGTDMATRWSDRLRLVVESGPVGD